jgi:hypothetical protein
MTVPRMRLKGRAIRDHITGRTLRGIDEQVANAAKAVAGLAPVKRNLFIQLDDAAESVNRELEAGPADLLPQARLHRGVV